MTISFKYLMSHICTVFAAALLISGTFSENRNRIKALFSPLVALAASVTGICFLVFALGNPQRVFSILAHVTAPFSMLLLSGLAVVVSAVVCLLKAPKTLKATLTLLSALLFAISLGRYYMIFTRPALRHPLTIITSVTYLLFLADGMNIYGKFRKIIFPLLFSISFAAFTVRIAILNGKDKVLQLPVLLNGGLSTYFWLVVLSTASAVVLHLLSKRMPLRIIALLLTLATSYGLYALFNAQIIVVKTMY
jgi:hypothetical protein